MKVASAIVLPEGSGPVRTVSTVSFAGPAGELEGLVNSGCRGARFAALVCHPHPMGGGTMHNRVVYQTMKALNDPETGLGLPVLRFNVRGVGLSKGKHHGTEESADVQAAMEWLEREYRLPVVAAGFSFGAAMMLAACAERPGVRVLAALGLPSETAGFQFAYPFLTRSAKPKLFLSGDCDEFAPAGELARIVEAAAEPKQLVLIPRADHFFTGQLEAMQLALTGWLKEQLA